MAELRTEEEQVEIIRKWWKENGTSLVVAVAIVLAGWFGYNYWQEQQQLKAEHASALYQSLVQGAAATELTADGRKSLTATATDLAENFTGSTYGEFGALFLARFAVEEEDFAKAESILKGLAEKSKHDIIKYTAQARLALVLIQQEKLDEALALVKSSPDKAYDAQFEEAKGDIYYLQNQPEEAKNAYQSALTATQQLGLQGSHIQRKLDMLNSGEG